MDHRSEYEYSYQFCAETAIIPLYNEFLRSRMRLHEQRRWYLFEIRTNFNLKLDRYEAMTIATERFGVAMIEYIEEGGEVVERGLESFMSERLSDYRMSDRDIRWLSRDALNFVERAAAEPQYAALPVIPAVVDLDIWTVQQEGEGIEETVDRAISPEYLFPLHLCGLIGVRDSDRVSKFVKTVREEYEQYSSDAESDHESYSIISSESYESSKESELELSSALEFRSQENSWTYIDGGLRHRGSGCDSESYFRSESSNQSNFESTDFDLESIQIQNVWSELLGGVKRRIHDGSDSDSRPDLSLESNSMLKLESTSNKENGSEMKFEYEIMSKSNVEWTQRIDLCQAYIFDSMVEPIREAILDYMVGPIVEVIFGLFMVSFLVMVMYQQ